MITCKNQQFRYWVSDLYEKIVMFTISQKVKKEIFAKLNIYIDIKVYIRILYHDMIIQGHVLKQWTLKIKYI